MGTIHLRVQSSGGAYAFAYSLDGKDWNTVKDSVDGTFLSTKTAGGFVGCLYALHSTSLGRQCKTTAYFDWFSYEGKKD